MLKHRTLVRISFCGLRRGGFTSYTEVALLASSENDVKVDIVAPMKEDNVASTKTHIGVVNVKKFWKA